MISEKVAAWSLSSSYVFKYIGLRRLKNKQARRKQYSLCYENDIIFHN